MIERHSGRGKLGEGREEICDKTNRGDLIQSIGEKYLVTFESLLFKFFKLVS